MYHLPLPPIMHLMFIFLVRESLGWTGAKAGRTNDSGKIHRLLGRKRRNGNLSFERKRRGSFEQWIRPTNRMKKKEGDEGNEQVGAGPVQDGLSPNQASMFPTEETGQTSG